MFKIKNIILFFIITFHLHNYGIIPERVILASDLNKNYIEFWPEVARWWREIIGINKITFAIIGGDPEQFKPFDNEIDILCVPRIKGVSTALYAQCIRLLIPILYQEDVCIISDVDMIPLSSDFFLKSALSVPNDHLLVYHDYPPNLGNEYQQRFPMCYVAATGKTFSEIFDFTDWNNFEKRIKEWSGLNWGWPTDEKILYRYITKWVHFKTHVTVLDIPGFYNHRLARAIVDNSSFDEEKVRTGFYFDAHSPRPYKENKKKVDRLLALLMKDQKILHTNNP